MGNTSQKSSRKIAILGGGPAGLAAAVALATSKNAGKLHIELFEAGSQLGGRTASFVDRASGVTLDACQHVLMGCCTATIDFCATVGILDQFDIYNRYHFFDASGQCHDFAATRGLPAPLHLLPGFWRLKYLTRADRLRIMRSLVRLEKLKPEDCAGRTIGDWLRQQGHSSNACQRFWAVVLVSALSETLDRASLAAARKVFVDGFLSSKDAYQLWVPRQPLGVLFDQTVGPWLENRGVTIHRNTPVRQLVIENQSIRSLQTDGQQHRFDQVIAAIPQRRLHRLTKDSVTISPVTCDGLETVSPVTCDGPNTLEDAPITAIHLWFDRPISNLPHAVLVDQGGNWMFRPPWAEPNYAQVVISESRDMLGLTREARKKIVQQITTELVQTVTQGSPSKLLRYYTITHPRAVFSVTPESDRCRPTTKTTIPNLFLAGDWTKTNWPATIEGAIRSGTKASKALEKA